jgi:hypothetical protein
MIKMNKETIITIIITLMVVTILILVGMLVLQKTSNQFLGFCAAKDWEGLHNITGDFSGEINCSEIWENEYANGMWAEKCSESPFNTKPSCKWLCVQDCKLINKEAGELICLC